MSLSLLVASTRSPLGSLSHLLPPKGPVSLLLILGFFLFPLMVYFPGLEIDIYSLGAHLALQSRNPVSGRSLEHFPKYLHFAASFFPGFFLSRASYESKRQGVPRVRGKARSCPATLAGCPSGSRGQDQGLSLHPAESVAPERLPVTAALLVKG